MLLIHFERLKIGNSKLTFTSKIPLLIQFQITQRCILIQLHSESGSKTRIRITRSKIAIFRWILNYSKSISMLYRCWWRMLESKCVGDNYKILVTVFVILGSNIHYFLLWRRPPTFERCHQYRISVSNIHKSSPTLSHQHKYASN